jgi:glucan phosphorylase
MAARNHLPGDRPVLFLFAGKAHPADLPGQETIRKIAQMAKLPEFEGRILLSKATTCTSRARWSPASMSGSTTRSTRSKPPAPRA